MMQLANAFDIRVQVGLLMEKAIGLDSDTGWYLIESNGRRRLGRPQRYMLRPPHNLVWYGRWPRFTAYSNTEALQKARSRLIQIAATHPGPPPAL